MEALKTKITQLQITAKRADGVLAKADDESIARHQATLQTVINEVDNLHLTIEAEKIAAKEDTTEWNAEINNEIDQQTSASERRKQWLEKNKKEQESIEREEKLQFEVKLLETKLKLQAEHEVASMKSNERLEDRNHEWNPS